MSTVTQNLWIRLKQCTDCLYTQRKGSTQWLRVATSRCDNALIYMYLPSPTMSCLQLQQPRPQSWICQQVSASCLLCHGYMRNEIISVFYFTCNHVWKSDTIISAAETISKLFQRCWTCWKLFASCNKLPKYFWHNLTQHVLKLNYFSRTSMKAKIILK